MDAQALRLLVEIGGNATQAVKALEQTRGGLSGLASTAGATGKALLGIGAAAVGIGATLGGIAVNAAASFEQRMSAVGAVAGATGAEMAQLSQLALDLGRDTAFSAGEAAAGIEELVKGGLSIQDILGGGARAALDLAAAGGINLAEAAEIAANAVGIFGLKGEQLGHVADQIAGAANASSLSVSDFRFSMTQAGAVANLVGQSFDDLAVGIAILGKEGLKGSDAGTSLKTMLSNLQPETKRQKEAMMDLGLWTKKTGSAFVDATGSFKSMAEIAGILQKATANLTDAQRAQALEAIFGSDAVRAAAIFAHQGARGFDDMAQAMGKVTAREVGAEKLNNLRGSLEALKGSAETAAITFGLHLTPVLKEGVDAATGLVNALIPVLDALGPKAAAAITGAAATIKGALAGLTGGLREGETRLGLMQLLGLDLEQADRAAAIINGVVDAIRSGFEAVIAIIQRVLVGDIAGAVTGVLDQMVEGRLRLVEILAGWGKALVEWLIAAGPAMLAEAERVAVALFEWAVAKGPELLARLAGWQEAVRAWVAPAIPLMLAELDRLATARDGWVATQAGTFQANLTQQWVPAAIAWAGQAANDLVPNLLKIADAVLVWIVDSAPSFVEKFLGEWLPAFLIWATRAAIDLVPELIKIQNAVVRWLGETAVQIGTWVATRGVPLMIEFFTRMGQAIVRGLIRGAQEVARELFTALADLARQAVEAAARAIGARSPSRLAAEMIGEPIVEGIIQGINHLAPAALDFMEGVGTHLVDAAMAGAAAREPLALDFMEGLVSHLVDTAAEIVPDLARDQIGIPLMEGILAGIQAEEKTLLDFLNKLGFKLVDAAAEILASVRTKLGQIEDISGGIHLPGIGGGLGGGGGFPGGGGGHLTPALAHGGLLLGGQTALVGERGPELFTAPATGMVRPLMPMTVNVYVSGSVVTEHDLIDAIHTGLLRKQQRAGALGLT